MTFRACFIGLACMVALSAMGLTSASAQEPSEPKPSDAPAIRACVAQEKAVKGKPHPCIDTIAKACMDEVGNDYDSTQRDCYRRGAAAWDVILNEEYARLRTALAPAKFATLRDRQRAWLKAKTAKCDGIYKKFNGTMALPMIAHCDNRETAERTLVLMRMTGDAR